MRFLEKKSFNRICKAEAAGSAARQTRARPLDVLGRYFSFAACHGLLTVSCLLAVVAATAATHALQASYLRANGFAPSFADGLVWLFGPENATQFPLLWCICPAVLMLWTAYADHEMGGANWALRHRGKPDLWIEQFCYCLFTACIIGALSFAAALFVSWSGSHSLVDFDQPHSLFAALTGAPAPESPSLAVFLGTSLALCMVVPAAFGSFFLLLKWCLSGWLLPFAIVFTAGLSSVHGSHSFVVDIAQLFGWKLDVVNPLSYLYDPVGIAYSTWLPGGAHRLWLYLAAIAIVALVGARLARRKDLLAS